MNVIIDSILPTQPWGELKPGIYELSFKHSTPGTVFLVAGDVQSTKVLVNLSAPRHKWCGTSVNFPVAVVREFDTIRVL